MLLQKSASEYPRIVLTRFLPIIQNWLLFPTFVLGDTTWVQVDLCLRNRPPEIFCRISISLRWNQNGMFRRPARKVAIFDTFDRLVHHIQQNVPATDIGKTKAFLRKFHTSFVANQIPETTVITFGYHLVNIIRITSTVTNHFYQGLGFVRTSSGFHQRFRPQQISFRITENYKRVVSCPCFFFLTIFFSKTGR